MGRSAGAVVVEVRRQFKEIAGIMEGHRQARLFPGGGYADRGRHQGNDDPLDPARRRAHRRRPLALGPQALGGLLVGTIVTGLFVAISMTTGGGAWDNAKKYIEDGHFGGKGSEAQGGRHRRHRRRPLQGYGRPGGEPLIKIINLVALLIVPLMA